MSYRDDIKHDIKQILDAILQLKKLRKCIEQQTKSLPKSRPPSADKRSPKEKIIGYGMRERVYRKGEELYGRI